MIHIVPFLILRENNIMILRLKKIQKSHNRGDFVVVIVFTSKDETHKIVE